MKTFVGIVVRAKTAKTAHVEVSSLWMHPVYRKKVKSTKVFACHDEMGVKEGDEVTIGETRPLSATKRFRIVGIVKQASDVKAQLVAAEAEVKPKKKTTKKSDKKVEEK